LFIGLLTCEGQIPTSLSLKDKRRVLQSVLTRIKNRWNLSVSEVGRQEDRQVFELAIVGVATAKHVVEKELQLALKLLEATDEMMIFQIDITFV
jgi:uncharacterized protein